MWTGILLLILSAPKGEDSILTCPKNEKGSNISSLSFSLSCTRTHTRFHLNKLNARHEKAPLEFITCGSSLWTVHPDVLAITKEKVVQVSTPLCISVCDEMRNSCCSRTNLFHSHALVIELRAAVMETVTPIIKLQIKPPIYFHFLIKD